MSTQLKMVCSIYFLSCSTPSFATMKCAMIPSRCWAVIVHHYLNTLPSLRRFFTHFLNHDVKQAVPFSVRHSRCKPSYSSFTYAKIVTSGHFSAAAFLKASTSLLLQPLRRLKTSCAC